MPKMYGKPAGGKGPLVGKSADKNTNNAKGGALMGGSKVAASNDMGNRPPKPSTTRNGSSFIRSGKSGK